MSAISGIEALARRDRLLVAAGLGLITVLAWAYLFILAAKMNGMTGAMAAMAMPDLKPWAATDFVLMFVMWAVMMAAMMTPSATPMILLYAAVSRRTQDGDRPVVHGGAFAAGYLAVWTGFSALATLLQWALEAAALLSPMMVGTSPYFGGALLIAAGVYQLTPLKNVCLKHCRSPVHFLASRWRQGARGAFRMGWQHGLYCLAAGC